MNRMDKNSSWPPKRILAPEYSFDQNKDKRLLIPFIEGDKVGFLNHDLDVVVPPQYSMYYGECYTKSDLIVVAKSAYDIIKEQTDEITVQPKTLYGMMASDGEEIISTEYVKILLLFEKGKKRIYKAVKEDGHCHAYFVYYNKEIGFYCHNDYDLKTMDYFWEGLARVSTEGGYGILNIDGAMIIEPHYKYIHPFYKSTKGYVIMEWYSSNKEKREYNLMTIDQIKRDYIDEITKSIGVLYDDSCDLINDGLDGVIDAFWNID